MLYISKRGTADGCILEKQVNHGCNHFLYCNQCLDELRSAFFAQHSRQTSRACLAATLKKKKRTRFYRAVYLRTDYFLESFRYTYLSSMPRFFREKLRGFVEGPLAVWAPTIPAPSVSSSMEKSLRTFSMVSHGFSKLKASEKKKKDQKNLIICSNETKIKSK